MSKNFSEIRSVLTVEEAAAELGIGRTLAYESVRTKQIPSIRIGRRVLIPRAAFEKALRGEPPKDGS